MSDDLYQVEAILDYLPNKKNPRYLVKWLGYPKSEATWEPLKNLGSLGDLIKEFHAKRAKVRETKKRNEKEIEIESVSGEENAQKSENKSARNHSRTPSKSADKKAGQSQKAKASKPPEKKELERSTSYQLKKKAKAVVSLPKIIESKAHRPERALKKAARTVSPEPEKPSKEPNRPSKPTPSQASTSIPLSKPKASLSAKKGKEVCQVKRVKEIIREDSGELKVLVDFGYGREAFWSFERAGREASEPLISFLREHIRFEK